MKKSAYGYITLNTKPKPPRLQRRNRNDEFEEMRDMREAYGSGFFSPALKRIIEQRIYIKKP